MRRIRTFLTNSGKEIRVYRKSETDEYVVRFYNHLGVLMDASDSFHSDKEDAINTARYCQEEEDKACADLYKAGLRFA